MHNLCFELDSLIRDTMLFLKDPLLPKQTLFASEEDLSFFRSKSTAALPKPKESPLPAPPPIPKPAPLPHKKERFPTQENPIIEEIIPNVIENLDLRPSQSPGIGRSNLAPISNSGDDSVAPIAGAFASVLNQIFSHVGYRPVAKPSAKIPESSNEAGFDKIKMTLVRVAPHVQLVAAVPDDTTAKKIAGGWKEKIEDAEVVLLACETDADTLDLLKSLGKAIDQNLAKAKIITAEKLEQEKRWDIFLQKNPFRLIVATEAMKKLPELMSFYHSVPAQSQFFLGKTPLLVLKNASIYKAIEQKAHLWKTLCQLLKK